MLRVVDHDALGDLQVQSRRVQARRHQRLPDIVTEARFAELTRRDVDADREAVRVRHRRLPLLTLAARLDQHVAADLIDQPGLLGDADELVGGDHAPHRVIPAQQRFDADLRTAAQVDDGLIAKHELIALQRALYASEVCAACPHWPYRNKISPTPKAVYSCSGPWSATRIR